MNIYEQIQYFYDNYTLVESYFLGKGKKISIGSKWECCRFCKKISPTVTFKNASHAVPEFLGNGQLILVCECDSCNTFFSNNLEDHLDKFTKPYRTIAKIKGKKKVPSNRSKDKRTRFDYKSGQPMKILAPVNGHAKIDNEKMEIFYNFEIEPHIPAAVYKCLVKIGLSILPSNEISNFTQATKWILDPNHSNKLIEPLLLMKSFIPGDNPNRGLTVMVLRKKDLITIRPNYYLVLGFGNCIYQIMLPSDIDLAAPNKNFIIIPFPTPFELSRNFSNIQKSVEDLSDHKLLNNKNVPITFSAGSIKRLEELEGKNLEEIGYNLNL